LALGALPIIYWLLRVTPPAPRRLQFPAIRLLRDLITREETPDRTPWWLLLLRLLLAALLIVALARPLLNPGAELPGSGPILLAVDNGWAAARGWDDRQRVMADVIDRAERADRDLILLPTAPLTAGEPVAASGLLRPSDARGLVDALIPRPWPTDRAAASRALASLEIDGSIHAIWLTDGLGSEAVTDFARALQRLGSAEILTPGTSDTAHLLLPPSSEGADLVVPARRVDSAGEAPLVVRATSADGRILGREQVTFRPGETAAEIRFTLPVELRNEAVRLDIENETTAGSAVLLDERWARRPVGIVSGSAQSEAQPLLSDTYYLERALQPFSEIRRGNVADLIASGLAVLVLPDTGAFTPDEQDEIARWIEQGGVVIRFAGPLLAANPDELVPVPLRLGDRILSGALSWSAPAPLASFAEDSPFDGLRIPPEIRIRRQVLAEPTLDLPDKTWARLADGTPLVTAERRGEGSLVLVHTTAGPEWSNLPLSGLFVEMLRKLVALSEGVAGATATASLDPVQTLDGFGRLEPPPPTVLPIPGDAFGESTVTPQHPPGFYGTEDNRRALNLGDTVRAIEPIGTLPSGIAVEGYAARGEVDLMRWLLAGALALLVLDLLIALALRGLLPPARRRVAASIAALALAGAPAMPDAHAQDEQFVRAATGLWFAYVETGMEEVDEASRAGLDALSNVLRTRTAVEADGAMAIDPMVDELAFFPLIYWPVVREQATLDDQAIERLNAYLQNGGTILFDTRDQAVGGGGLQGGPGAQRLRDLLEGMDIPPLTPLPPEHVLTKSFYLMQEFPGRYEGGEVWVENGEETVNDGVSSVIIGSNDWAGAWAVGANGMPLYPVVPGNERQREMAYRFGVNLVMYALTGNYKADQVHVPAILERLGQ
ncbi:MAG TPA: DUF4159 domain-containing protein, partial [Alphaproteobacteria bacterium]|nr:DUF4159 domain-containing protein [Alphaproteobacteria bacterium]